MWAVSEWHLKVLWFRLLIWKLLHWVEMCCEST